MPVVQGDVDQANQELITAQQQLAAAQQELSNTPPTTAEGFARRTQLTDQIKGLKDTVSQAQHKKDAAQNQLNHENPVKTTPATTATQQTEIEQGKANQARYGNNPEFNVPNRILQQTISAYQKAHGGSPPPRQDSPAQTTTATSGAQNAATNVYNAEQSAAHQQNQDANAAITQQREALQAQGLLFQNIRGQVVNAAQTDVQAQTAYQTNAREAATAILSSQTQQRQQDIERQNAKQKFIDDVITTAMPRVAELMMNTPKGSKIPQQFLLGFLAIANDAAEKAGLNKEIPPVDMNSPLVRNAVKFAEAPIPNKPPQMPDIQNMNWDTARSMAVGGFPVNGWTGPIGAAATQMPPMPPGTKGDGSNPQATAAQSPEGQAIANKYEANLKAQGVQDPLHPKNADEAAKVEQARAAARAEIEGLAKTQQTAKATTPSNVSEAQQLKNEVRATLVSGDDNQRAKVYGEILAAQEAIKQGQPLTDTQQILLNNVDQKDLDLIQQHIGPIMPLLVSRNKGEPLTDEQNQQILTGMGNVTNDLKQRDMPPNLIPLPENTPKPAVPTTTPESLTPRSKDIMSQSRRGQAGSAEAPYYGTTDGGSAQPIPNEQQARNAIDSYMNRPEPKPVDTYDTGGRDIPDFSQMSQQYDQQQQQSQQEDIPDLSMRYNNYQDDEEERKRKEREGLFSNTYNWGNI